jgi:hypothetical protein
LAARSATPAVPEMGDAGRLGDLDRLQLDLPGAVLVEQPDAVTEQEGDEVELELVQQPGLDELLCGAGAAHHRDPPVPRRGLRLLEGALGQPPAWPGGLKPRLISAIQAEMPP